MSSQWSCWWLLLTWEPPPLSEPSVTSENSSAPRLRACRASQRSPALHAAWEGACGANSGRSLFLPRQAGRPSLSFGIMFPRPSVSDSLGQPRPRRCQAVVARQARRLASAGRLRRGRVLLLGRAVSLRPASLPTGAAVLAHRQGTDGPLTPGSTSQARQLRRRGAISPADV